MAAGFDARDVGESHRPHQPAVTFEEWSDAEQVASANSGGARKSAFSNKMNEGAPHRLWATKVQRRATAFGVLAEGHSFVSLLGG